MFDVATATFVAVAFNVAVAADRLRARRPDDLRGRCRAAPRAGAAPAGSTRGLRHDRAVGPDRALRRSDLDAAAVAAFRRHGLHLRADPGGVPRRPRHRQHRRRDDRARHRVAAARARLVPAAAVRRDRVGGVRAHRVAAVLADQSRTSRPRRGSRCSSIWCAASGSCCRARCSGARAFRWRSPRWRRPSRTRRGWPAASTPPTPSARSSARWRRASS